MFKSLWPGVVVMSVPWQPVPIGNPRHQTLPRVINHFPRYIPSQFDLQAISFEKRYRNQDIVTGVQSLALHIAAMVRWKCSRSLHPPLHRISSKVNKAAASRNPSAKSPNNHAAGLYKLQGSFCTLRPSR